MAARAKDGVVVKRVPIPQRLDNALVHASIMEGRAVRYVIQDALTEYIRERYGKK